ncbi:urease accessory protein UreD [Streptomyces sp. NPDC048606]|uniref:urease accessory protein UreD n=1 Tax=Streptomyces sp. NPDC048606 TaxID=3154726 RepID=UPI00343C9E68
MTSAPPAPRAPAGGLRATARVRAVSDGRGGTSLPLLAGEGPLALRRTRGEEGAAHVTLVGAMSAPLGGDHLTIEAEAGPGARLALGSAAATLALPGRGGEPARYDVRLTLAGDAEVRWLPEPLVSVRGSDLRVRTRVDVAPTARLLLREEQVLGRTGEAPGLLWSRLTVTRGGRPLLDQELACGPGAPGGWDGPAGLAGHRALGQLLVVDPRFEAEPPEAAVLGEFAALTPLAGPAALVTALAPDALRLRELLDGAARAYGL